MPVGEAPDPVAPPPGCRFLTRCWKATQHCTDQEPALVDRHGHPSACHIPQHQLFVIWW